MVWATRFMLRTARCSTPGAVSGECPSSWTPRSPGNTADRNVRPATAALGAQRAMQNLYEISIQEESAAQEIAEEFKAAIAAPTTEEDSHPSPQDRYRYIEKIRSSEVDPLLGEVWDLFADRAAIKEEMHLLIEKLVRPGHQPSGDGILGI